MSLAELRFAFRDESLIERLTASAPPVTRTVQESGGRYEVLEEAEPADANGRNLSAAMVTLIGSITSELNFYPPRFPVRRALAEWERTCRRRHRPPTWRDHAAGPICSTMLRVMVEGGATLLYAANSVELEYPRAERLVAAGEKFVWERLFHWDHERAGIALDPDCSRCRTRGTPFRLDKEEYDAPNVIHAASA